MAWRPAYSLSTLKSQLDATYPGWLFLGFIGDQSHASVPSDHNPNASGVVCALDIGPGGGLNIHALADSIAGNRHPNLKYIISNRRILGAWTGWKWAYYAGSDPHDTHIHISVGVGPDGQSTQPYDDTIKWNIGGNVATDSLTKEEIILAFAQQYDVPEDKVNQDVVKAFTGKPLGQYLNFVKNDPSYQAHFKAVNTPGEFNVYTGAQLYVKK